MQLQPMSETTNSAPMAFSVGASGSTATATAQPKVKRSLISKLFGFKNKESAKPAAVKSAPARQNPTMWQRSKSIFKGRPDYLHGSALELPSGTIVGSGSYAKLMACEDKCEYTIDLHGMLNSIFNENDAYYRTGIAGTIEDAAAADDDEFVQSAFNDNPKLDSPLLPDDEVGTCTDEMERAEEESDRYSECVSDISTVSLETALRSFASGEYNISDAKSYSTDEIAEMFGVLTVNDKPAEILPDGSVRVPVGSEESIRFENCWQTARNCQSEEPLSLNLTEIKINTETATVKQRCQSLANFSKISGKEMAPDAAALKRRSLGAKVSEIVALYEEAFRRSSK